MKCPFLRESRAKFCQATPYRKIIEQTVESTEDRCTSSAFNDCAAFKEQRGHSSTPPCPFLQESRAQVCAKDPSVRLVPCSDQALSRCATENYRYCNLFLTEAHSSPVNQELYRRFPIPPPLRFFFARNHMWLDVSPEHDCHIGLDALVARLLGRVDRLSFITGQGEQCPSVVITVHGVNVHVVFPNPMRIASANAQVRVDPGKMVHDPYGAGWLFEGTEPGAHDIRRGLLSGPAAQRWMDQEAQRITEILNRCIQGKDATRRATAADGGIPVEGILRRLKRHEISKFFDELFKTEEVM